MQGAAPTSSAAESAPQDRPLQRTRRQNRVAFFSNPATRPRSFIERITQLPRMILPLVSELLSRVARRAVVEEALDTVRRGGSEVRLSGLTDSAKALIVPLAFAELGRPTILLVESNIRAPKR